MFGIKFQAIDESAKAFKAVENATFRNISHGAASIRKDAIASIVPAEGPSEPGKPPHTHTQTTTRSGKTRKGVFPKAIAFAVDKQAGTAIIGARAAVVGQSFHAHEFGDVFHGEDYPERPTMWPALLRNAARIGDSFAGSIGG